LAITLPESWESYLAQLSENERTKLAYRTRRLEKAHVVRFRRCSEEAELPTCLETLFQLHKKRWQLRGQAGSFASEGRRKFYGLMARSFLARQWLEFWLLELNGRTVAAQFGFRYGDTFYILQEGFDPEYSTDSVGNVLRGHVLGQLIGEGVRHYDFLAGQEASKKRWGALPGNYLDIHLAKAFTRGSIYLRLRHDSKVTKEWLRAHLPGPVFEALRWSYRRIRPAKASSGRPAELS